MNKINGLILATLLSGCAGTLKFMDAMTNKMDGRPSQEQIDAATKARRDQYVVDNPSTKENRKAAILAGKVTIGMSPAEVIASWGHPSNASRSVVEDVVVDQWRYGSAAYGDYIYFKAGRVFAFQQ